MIDEFPDDCVVAKPALPCDLSAFNSFQLPMAARTESIFQLAGFLQIAWVNVTMVIQRNKVFINHLFTKIKDIEHLLTPMILSYKEFNSFLKKVLTLLRAGCNPIPYKGIDALFDRAGY